MDYCDVDPENKIEGWDNFQKVIKQKYKDQNIHYRNSSGAYTYALLFSAHSKNLMVGVFNCNTQTGKVYDRRKVDRE